MQNEMMHRPIVDERVLNFMRTGQKPMTGHVKEIQNKAIAEGIPIIPEETAVFMRFLFGIMPVRNVLEIGTAVGFSSSLMDQLMHEEGHVTTIDRFDFMIERAHQNFDDYQLSDRITLLEGQAADILPTLEDKAYDFIFMDSAKSKYIEFLSDCLRVLKIGSVLMIDDIFQAGTVFDDDATIKRGARKIHRRLKELLEVVNETDGLVSTTLPLGDGVLLIQKVQDTIILPPLRD